VEAAGGKHGHQRRLAGVLQADERQLHLAPEEQAVVVFVAGWWS
jgi:hypothetical protein